MPHRDSDPSKPSNPLHEMTTLYPDAGVEPIQEATEDPVVPLEPEPAEGSGARVPAIEPTVHPFASGPAPAPDRTVHPFGGGLALQRAGQGARSKAAPERTSSSASESRRGAEARPENEPSQEYGARVRFDPAVVPDDSPASGTESLELLARRLSLCFSAGLSNRARACVERVEGDSLEARRALVATWWLTDGVAMTRLIDLGVRADSIAFVFFVPLVAAAWADGKLSKSERATVFEVAEQNGLSPNDTIHPALAERLDTALDDAILRAWLAYVDVFSNRVDAELLAQVLDRIRDGARRIAEVSGGLLGVGRRISAAEAALLERLENPARMTLVPFSA